MIRKPMTLAWASLLLVVSLGVLGWSLFPERQSSWVYPGLFLAALWAFLEVMQSGDSGREKAAIMNWHRAVIAVAGLFAALGLGFRLAGLAGLLDAEWEPIRRRTMGLLLGVGMVIWGNYVPKLLSPWSVEDEPFEWQRVHRFAGWTATLAGIAMVVVWLTLPVETARLAARAILGPAFVLVVGRKLISVVRPSPRRPPPSPRQARPKDDLPSVSL